MRVTKISLHFTAVVTLLFLFSCTSTKFPLTWKDETYHGHPKKILVINAFPNSVNRRLFEDELVQALKDRGIDAVASYTLTPSPEASDKKAIEAAAKEVGADTVLINRALGTTDVSSGYGYLTYVDLYINTQTDVYDMKSNRLVLSASAETWIRHGEPYSSRIHSYVKDLVHKLSQQGLF
jgi:hypothetical protein